MVSHPGEIMQRISSPAACPSTPVLDATNVNSQQPLSLPVTLLDLVLHVQPARCVRANQNNRDAGSNQLPVYPGLDAGIPLPLHRLPRRRVHERIRRAFLKQPAIADLANTPTV